MRYCISGSIGVGKSTLIDILSEDFTVVPEVCRYVSSYGFSINNHNDNIAKTQLAMLNTMYSNIISNQNAFFDRGLLDILVFSYYLYEHEFLSENEYNFISDNIVPNLYLFDKIFYLPIEFELKSDGFRSTDENFRKEIDFLFQLFINKLNIKSITIGGSVEERIATIKNYIN